MEDVGLIVLKWEWSALWTALVWRKETGDWFFLIPCGKNKDSLKKKKIIRVKMIYFIMS